MSVQTRSLVIGVGGFPQAALSEEDRARGVESFTRLDSVRPAVEELARALQRAGVQPAIPPLIDPTREEVKAAWRRMQDEHGEHPLVVHFSGHGARSRGKPLYLAPLDGEATAERVRETCISVDRLLEDVEESFAAPVLFLLDVCGGGQALATQLAQEFSGWERKAWVIAACKANEVTHGATFTKAAAAVLDRLVKNELDLSPALEYVPLDTLAAEVDRELARTAKTAVGLRQSVVRTMREEAHVDPPPFLLNPSYAPDAAGRFLAREDANLRQFATDLDPGLDPLHFITRAAGRTAGHQQSTAFLFRGRTAQLRTISTWLDNTSGDQSRLLVVTGGPGSGKSALLGVTVCVTHPALAPLRQHALAAIGGFRPASGKRVIAVHARQLSTQQIADSLLSQLTQQRAPHARRGSEAGDGTWALKEALQQAGPTVVILDALDEAINPGAVLRDLVLPLSGHSPYDPAPECRVVIGTRPWWETFHNLQEAVTERPEVLLDLDAHARDDLAQDLAAYLDLLLYGLYSRATTDSIAHELAHHAEHGAFLIAAIFGDHLRREAHSGRALSDDEIAAKLPYSITQMFDLHTTALVQANPWIRPLLAVLGHARGQGMPLDLLHTAALRIAPEFRDRPVPPDLQETRDALTQVAFYLRSTPDEDQRLLYRYFHQALTDSAASTVDPRTIYRALFHDIPERAEGRPDWERAQPYLQRHAAAHAAAVSRKALDALLADPFFLLHAHPDHLAPYLASAREPQAAQHSRIYRNVIAHHPRRHEPSVRRDLLALDAAAWRNTHLASTLAEAPLNHQPARLAPQWAIGHTTDPARLHTLADHTGDVSTSTATLPDGRAVAITGHNNGELRVWNLATGEPIHPPLVGHDATVGAVTSAVMPDGRSVAVAGHSYGIVRIWDLVTGQQIRPPFTRHTATVSSAASAVLPDGRSVAITGDRSGKVLVWDLDTGELIHPPLSGHTDWVFVAASALSDGRTVAVTCDNPGTLFVWDLATGTLIHRSLEHAQHEPGKRRGPRAVLDISSAALPDGRTVAITGDMGGWVFVWDLAAGDLMYPPFDSHADAVFAVAPAVLPDGRVVAVTGHVGHSVLLWDLATGQQIGPPLTGHTESLTDAASVVLPDGRTVAVTGDRAGKVIVWDLAVKRRTRPVGNSISELSAISTGTLANGRGIALVGDRSGAVLLRDLATGEQIHPPLTGHSKPVAGAASAVLADGRDVAITSDWSGTLIIWDLTTGYQIHRLYMGIDDSNPGYVYSPAVVTEVLNDCRTIAAASDKNGTVFVWDLATGEQIHPSPGGSKLSPPPATQRRQRPGRRIARVKAIASAVLPDGRSVAITGDSNGSVLVWDLTTGKLIHSPLAGHDARVREVASAVLPDGRTVAITSDESGEIRVWDLVSGKQDRSALLRRAKDVYSVASGVLPDGRTVAITGDRRANVRIWDVVTGQHVDAVVTLAPAPTLAATPMGVLVGYGRDIAHLTWRASSNEATPNSG
ncbi:AAA family ATPase [Streptomyces sp. NPDC088354]|uniref:AAA family ATPase n=1 Tax=Streptomyces sp. NPDC088354 TaxID=3365856 RepID=UPI00380B0165